MTVSGALLSEIADGMETFASVDDADLAGLVERVQGARVVLIGEATHGTSEFYRLRARLTQILISQHGFGFVAIEGDWPDAARIDHYVRDLERPKPEWAAFARFPTWMWRNREVHVFVEWLREHNAVQPEPARASVHGLDLYSLGTSIRAVLEYLDDVDPDVAAFARKRYECLTPWQLDPADYGRAALRTRFHSCEGEVAHMLARLLAKQREYAARDSERYLDAVQNARLIANAEHYYRIMYYGSRASWNLRDSHMFETLQLLLAFHGERSKGIVWAHNSHVGDARATEMGAAGEHNIGQLCKEQFGEAALTVGFGTDHGTVAATAGWDQPMEIMPVRPARPDSFEGIFHAASETSGASRYVLNLSAAGPLNASLAKARLERAIGVVYRPETERASHYFHASLARQFDEYIWLDETSAVTPLEAHDVEAAPDTYPFGL